MMRPIENSAVRGIVVVVVSLVMCRAASAAVDTVQGTDAEKVQLQVWSIRATRSNNEISSELKPLADSLKKTFNFTGYKLVKADTGSVELNDTYKSALTGSFAAEVTPRERAAGSIKLAVTITKREGDKDVKKLSTTVTLREERFQLFGGWKLSGDDVLIIAISAK